MTKPKNITQALSYISGVFHQRDTGYVSPIIEIDPYKGIRRSIKQSKKAAKASAKVLRESGALSAPKVKAPKVKTPKKDRSIGRKTPRGTVTKVYSPKSKVIKAIPEHKSVEITDEEGKRVKGYLAKESQLIKRLVRKKGQSEYILLKAKGKFTTLTDYERMIYSLDKAVDPSMMRFSMALATMNDRMRAIINRRVQAIDWNKFWTNTQRYDPSKGGLHGDGEAILKWIFDGTMTGEEMDVPLAVISTSQYMK